MQRQSLALALGMVAALSLGAAPREVGAQVPARTRPAPKAGKRKPASRPAPRPAVPRPTSVPTDAPPEIKPAEPAEAPAPPPVEPVAAAEPASSAATESKPAPPPPAEIPPAPLATPKLEALQAEYAALKDALFRSRARREALEKALFSTQLEATLVWDGSRHHQLQRAEVRLDGARMWDSGDSALTDEPTSLGAKSAPPGPHVLTVRIEVRARENPKLGYVSEQSFAVTLVEGKKTRVTISVDEDGDLPSYNPDIDVEVEVD